MFDYYPYEAWVDSQTSGFSYILSHLISVCKDVIQEAVAKTIQMHECRYKLDLYPLKQATYQLFTDHWDNSDITADTHIGLCIIIGNHHDYPIHLGKTAKPYTAGKLLNRQFTLDSLQDNFDNHCGYYNRIPLIVCATLPRSVEQTFNDPELGVFEHAIMVPLLVLKFVTDGEHLSFMHTSNGFRTVQATRRVITRKRDKSRNLDRQIKKTTQ
jgi:hypothetical protein